MEYSPTPTNCKQETFYLSKITCEAYREKVPVSLDIYKPLDFPKNICLCFHGQGSSADFDYASFASQLSSEKESLVIVPTTSRETSYSGAESHHDWRNMAMGEKNYTNELSEFTQAFDHTFSAVSLEKTLPVTLIGSSLGAAMLLDYISQKEILPKQIIFIAPYIFTPIDETRPGQEIIDNANAPIGFSKDKEIQKQKNNEKFIALQKILNDLLAKKVDIRVIYGNRDTVVLDSVNFLKTLLPEENFKEIPDAGHTFISGIDNYREGEENDFETKNPDLAKSVLDCF
jgi:predicted esterase